MNSLTRRGFLGIAGVAPVAAGLGFPLPAHAQGHEAGVSTESDVVFGKGGELDLRCDVYRPPPGVTKRMATIHIHGGGFTGGSKTALTERIRPYAARGYVAIAPQYRLAGQAKWPAQIEDVKAAIRWTRANARTLGIDPDRIAVIGHSAGGHLALMAAGTQNRPELEGRGGNPGVGTKVAACVAYYPSTEARPRRDGTVHVLLAPGSDAAAHRAASPTTYVARGFPPTVIFHGVADTTIPIESSQRFFQLLRDVDVPTELHSFAGAPHSFDRVPEFAAACTHLADLFIDRYVTNPRAFPSDEAARRG